MSKAKAIFPPYAAVVTAGTSALFFLFAALSPRDYAVWCMRDPVSGRSIPFSDRDHVVPVSLVLGSILLAFAIIRCVCALRHRVYVAAADAPIA